nr:PREDICTED: leukocyte elastase inhibitor-like [Lepisosteus oculatus]
MAMDSLSSANTQFCLDLFRKLNEVNPGGNVFISPLSITAALAMVYLGAKGQTATQMAKVACKIMGGLSFSTKLCVLPEDISDGSTGLEKLEKELTLEKMQEWTKRENMDTGTDILVHLPKFKLQDDYELSSALAGLGMVDVFDSSGADLSGMNGGPGLSLSAVVHKSFIEVNEEGTEAAAATAGIVAFCMLREERFTADHPFLFFIRHNKSNSILFFGRFSSP